MSEEKRQFKSGATSTKQPRLSLIPSKGLVNAAIRFELGLERHPDGCYNALTNQAPLEDKDWLIERCSHAIQHCYNIIDKLKNNEIALEDSGALAWAGLVLGEAFMVREEKDYITKANENEIAISNANIGRVVRPYDLNDEIYETINLPVSSPINLP